MRKGTKANLLRKRIVTMIIEKVNQEVRSQLKNHSLHIFLIEKIDLLKEGDQDQDLQQTLLKDQANTIILSHQDKEKKNQHLRCQADL